MHPFIEDECIANADNLPGIPHEVHPMLHWLNIHCKITGNSRGTWKCYNSNCSQRSNSVIFDLRCKTCQGSNPYLILASSLN